MPKSSLSPPQKLFIDDVIASEKSDLELGQQMIWVQIRKTIPNVWFMVSISIWLASCFAYVWETCIVESFQANENALLLLAGILIPAIHYIAKGVMPLKALHYSRGLTTQLECIAPPSRLYAQGVIAAVVFMIFWFSLWLFEMTIAYRIGGYFLLASLLTLILLAYREHYQKSLQVDY
ncbi:hypothetical protein FE810_05130 [Thalassotalea litorea]|uniref:Uncharacterized protein n=1 Tax=Thalassotalea litorea TaxID=2020715 RepID=A0A5R9IMX5_9GAMM|nr:hypothetical protein [Thalassotalea litorea]TLU66890.1 hypothetical protein FE810_05130 [Thalassotalea litorea]